LKVNHQLESRMPEIGLFGSEGGAPTHGVPTLSDRRAKGETGCSPETPAAADPVFGFVH
jgi:hypothetical protein